MKIFKIFFAAALTLMVLSACKNDAKKEQTQTDQVAGNKQNLSLNISGMTCEIGCARTIQSKLSKKEGIIEAKVIFKDSLATIAYDADKISKQEIMSFVDGIASGDLYKTSEHKSCGADCKKAYCTDKDAKKECKGDCKKDCDKDKAAHKECKKDSTKAYCTSKDSKKECKGDCKKDCDKDKATHKECKKDCTKACCTENKKA